MKRLGSVWHIVLVVSVGIAAPVAVAWACSLAPAPIVQVGWLGFAFDGAAVPEPRMIPRNAAVRGDSAVSLSDGTPVPVERLPELGTLFRVVDPLPVGATVQSASHSAVVADVIDVTPPSAPAIAGGAFEISEDDSGCALFGSTVSSCGDIIRVTVDLEPAIDDATPVAQLSYALFLGETRTEVEAATIPDDIYVRDFQGAIWRFADREEGDRDIWVSVAAIDLAGNVGPRTEPTQIHSADDGCAVQRVGGRTQTPIAIAFAAAVLVWRARRRRA